jgi:hypothetical protein
MGIAGARLAMAAAAYGKMGVLCKIVAFWSSNLCWYLQPYQQELMPVGM